ncbi:class I SAM-dependent methyltransferase [soil metagenome]
MDRAVYDRMKEIDDIHWWFVARRKIVRALLSRDATPDRKMRILEVGCGTGSNLAMLKSYGVVDAIEPDDDARNVAIERSQIAVRGGFLPDGVKLEDGVYDIVVLLDVLEHIGDDLGTLQALKAKLTPTGKLLITVPANPWLWSEHDVAHHHQRRYTQASLSKVLTAAGYRIDHQSHFNTLLFPLIVLMRAIGRVTGRGGGDDAVPHRAVNWILQKTFGAESLWVPRIRMPWGVSIAAVARSC